MKYFILLTLALSLPMASFAQKRMVSPEEAEYLRMIEKQKIDTAAAQAKARESKAPTSDFAKELNSPSTEMSMPTDVKAATTSTPAAPATKLPPLMKASKKSAPSKVYVPAPVIDQASQNGYLTERDSTKIVNVKLSQNDVLNVNVCYSAGVQVALDDSLGGEKFQRTIIDDADYFEAKEFSNKRGVYFKLKEPIQPGFYWESALRLVSENNDRAYLINLLGVPCPEGPNPFPKIYYIGAYTEKIGGSNTAVMTPEDMIITASEGLPRRSQNAIRVYDMVATAGSRHMVFGVEIQYPKVVPEKEQLLMKVLDNLQTSIKKSNMIPLALPSAKASEHYGVPTLRFNLVVNIDKDYIINRRYIYLMVLSKATNHYQYKQIDLLPYFQSLKKRGFKL